jgi:uncharacterized protein (TIRG00374 family)
MNKKRALISGVIVAVMVGLVYLQVREWQKFDWGKFWSQTGDVRWLYVVSAIALIYATYIPRALRWKILLRPVCRTSTSNLLAPTVIGFTALALLGRPGELALRPYLIARRTGQTMSDQMAVWTVERIFDTGAFAVLVALDLVASPGLHNLPYFERFRDAAPFFLVGTVLALTAFAVAARRSYRRIAPWAEHTVGKVVPGIGRKVAQKIFAFGEGLNTIHDVSSFVQVVALSLFIWVLIALSYHQIVHAYPAPLSEMSIAHVILLMGFSIVGSTVQLPVVGGGAQLATIAALLHVFSIPHELAVSAGIMLWLVTFLAVTPLGLVLAHREHVSLTKVTRESAREQAAEMGAKPGA